LSTIFDDLKTNHEVFSDSISKVSEEYLILLGIILISFSLHFISRSFS